MPTYHLDGAFQTFSGLFRLLERGVPFLDFIPYLGIGPLLSIFPAFLIAGGSLVASVVASKLMTLLISQVSFALVFSLTSGERGSRKLLIATSVFSIFAVGTSYSTGFLAENLFDWGWVSTIVRDASMPGWSLRPIRAAAPYITTALILFIRNRWPKKWLSPAAWSVGVISGLWSNDYALPNFLVFTAVIGLLALRERGIKSAICSALHVFGSYVAVVLIATQGNLKSFVQFNFIDVPSTQYWYFGPWASNTRVTDIHQLFSALSTEGAIVPAALLIASTLWQIRKKNANLVWVNAIGLIVFLGGLTGTIGGHVGGYFWSFKFWGLIFSVAAIATLISKTFGARETHVNRNIKRLFALFSAIATIFLAVNLIGDSRAAITDKSRVYSVELGGYLDRSFLQLAKQKHKDVVEEYFGITSSLGRYDHAGLKVDSVIHALGSQRVAFEKALSGFNGTVITTAPQMDSAWVSWNFSANWFLYKQLLARFNPTISSPNTVTWYLKKDGIADKTNAVISCSVDLVKQRIKVPSEISGLYELTLQNLPKPSGRNFHMIENNINFAGDAEGFLSLDPHSNEQRFPVYFMNQKTLKLKGKFQTIDPSAIRCDLRKVDLSSSQFEIYKVLFGVSLNPSGLTDSNWINGYHRYRAGFFVPKNKYNLKPYLNAREIIFNDGTVRRITKIEVVDSYINVWLEGTPIKGENSMPGFKIVQNDGSLIQ